MARYHHNDCSRAALIYFKDGVSQEQAERALRLISDHLKPVSVHGEESDAGMYVQEYDPCMGGPVWYIP